MDRGIPRQMRHALASPKPSGKAGSVKSRASRQAWLGQDNTSPDRPTPDSPGHEALGTPIHGEHAPQGGNQHRTRAMFLSAFAALRDPAPTPCDTCRTRGKPAPRLSSA